MVASECLGRIQLVDGLIQCVQGASGTCLDLMGTAGRMGSAAVPTHGLFSVAVSGESHFLRGGSGFPEKVFQGNWWKLQDLFL